MHKLSNIFTVHRVIPAPAAKEFIIPLIKKNQWRLQSSPDKKKDQDKKTSGECVSNREDKEAADAILKGQFLRVNY